MIIVPRRYLLLLVIMRNDDGIAAVTAVVWHNEDQSDLQWVELPQNGRWDIFDKCGTLPNFNLYWEYHIHVYAVNTEWTAVCPRRREWEVCNKDENIKHYLGLTFGILFWLGYQRVGTTVMFRSI